MLKPIVAVISNIREQSIQAETQVKLLVTNYLPKLGKYTAGYPVIWVDIFHGNLFSLFQSFFGKQNDNKFNFFFW